MVAIGIPGLVAAGLHLFDGPALAAEIGFTRGDGGFQTEVGFADLAIGIAAVGCVWFRDRYWLAVIVMATIFLMGDAYGHVHQWIENDNDDPDNTGLVLYADVLVPLVVISLYAIRERAKGQGAPTPEASAP